MMVFLYVKDLIPIFVSFIFFSFLALSHRVILPNKYSSFLQFEINEDEKKTAQSTAIRILYLIIGTILLNHAGLASKQIAIGIFLSCFLNIWPAIIQHRLLRIDKSCKEWYLLIGYLLFIIFSILVEQITINILIPVLCGNKELFLFDNQTVSILFTLFFMAIPIPIELVMAKISYVVIDNELDTFLEEIYILERKLNQECPKIKNNIYLIDNVAREKNININLITTILKLELFYRNRFYYYFLEKFLCRFLSKVAINKDISVGIAQIKISTAQKLLHQNPNKFIKNITNDDFNIQLCAHYIRDLIDEYNYKIKTNDSFIKNIYYDIFDYIACNYVGGLPYNKNQTVLVYGAVLRNLISQEQLSYTGSYVGKEYNVILSNRYIIEFEKFENLVKQIECSCTIGREIFLNNKSMCIELYCMGDDIETIRNISEEYDLYMQII